MGPKQPHILEHKHDRVDVGPGSYSIKSQNNWIDVPTIFDSPSSKSPRTPRFSFGKDKRDHGVTDPIPGPGEYKTYGAIGDQVLFNL